MRKHHSLLQSEEASPDTFSGNKLHLDKPTEGNQRFETSLPTAIVSVVKSDNQLLQCRALLDSGSQLSFTTDTLAKKLKLNPKKTQLNLSGIGGKPSDVEAGLAVIVLKSDSREGNVTAYVLKQLTKRIPSISVKQLKLPENFEMADHHYHVSKPVDIILVADVFEELIENQREEVSPGLFLRKIIYGWVVLG